MAAFLTDFGLARAVATGSRYTRTGEALGTPAYMSPEQARGETDLTPASDLWALGCVLYELLAGRRAFDGETPADVVGQVITTAPPSLRRLRPDLPIAVEEIVGAMLAHGPHARPASAGLLRDDLVRVLAGVRPVHRPRRSRRALAVAAGLAGLVIVGTAAYTAAPPGGGGPSPADADTETAATVAAAWNRRHADPAAAAVTIEDAIRGAPGRAAWRIQAGLLRWAAGEIPGALAHWQGLPPGSAEAATGELYVGLLRLFEREPTDRARTPLTRALGGPPETARLARAALAVVEKDWPAVEHDLRGVPGWEAALLRSWAAGHRPGDSSAEVRAELLEALGSGIPFWWAYHNRAIAHRECGDLPAALADHAEALRRHPGDGLIVYERARTRLQAGDRAGAAADIEVVLARRSDLAGAWVVRAKLRADAEDVEGVLAATAAALAREPDHGGAWHWTAWARLKRGELAGALTAADRAVEIGDDRERGHLLRAEIRSRLSDHAGALADLDAIGSDERDRSAWWQSRASALEQLGRRAEAVESATQAIRLAPEHFGCWQSRARARSGTGDYAGALADMDEAVRLAPDDDAVRTDRAIVRRLAGDLAGAVADLDGVLARNPGRPTAWLERARVHQAAGRHEAAEAAYAELLVRQPGDVLALLERGQARLARQEFEAAQGDFEAVLGLAPDRAEAWVGLGESFRLRRRFTEAQGAFARAVARQPSHRSAQLGLALASYESADWPLACAALRETLRLWPDHLHASDLRGKLAIAEERLRPAPARDR